MEQQAQNTERLTADQLDERRLVAKVLRKDRKATADFVSRYADSVFAYVCRRVWPRKDLTEDLVQETFLRHGRVCRSIAETHACAVGCSGLRVTR